jgi:hypothetical protein
MVFPFMRWSAGVMEWWSNGVMKETIQTEFGLLLLPTLQYSKCSSTPKQIAIFTGKALVL